MSTYSHDPHKFASTGLQLRMPVDLIPSTQYGRLTNAIPVIEGEISTRDGMTLQGSPAFISFICNLVCATGSTLATGAITPFPHGLIANQQVTITVSYSLGINIPAGSYTVTVTSVPTSTTFNFSPGISTAATSGPAQIQTFAQVISSSPGLNTLTNTPIDNLFRLNEAVANLTGDLLATTNGRVYHAPLPSGSAFEEIVGPLVPGATLIPLVPTGFSGRPMAIIGFRFTLDSASWAIFADQNLMYKYRPGATDSAIEFVPLGNAPPTVAATATAGGTGNLNSSGGTGYDWVYTFIDGLAMTESNPSPTDMSSGGITVERPTNFTNPAVTGDSSFTNPFSAIDPSATTFANGVTQSNTSPGTSQQGEVSCQWFGIAQPTGTVSAQTLNVVANLTVSSQTFSGGFGSASVNIQYSQDNGATYQIITSLSVSGTNAGNNSTTGQQTFSTVIPSAISPTNILIKIVGNSLADDGANSIANIAVYDINLSVNESGATQVLDLTNQSANVCVKPSPFPQHTIIGLYRRGGSLTDTWRLVGQFPINTLVQGSCGAGTLLINDNVSDTTLSGSLIVQLDNNQPVSSVSVTVQPLPFIWGPVGYDVRVLGCGDPARPESIYFSKPGNADSWPPENFLEVSDPGTPIVAGCAFNTRIFAFSRESIFELVEGLGTGTVYTPFRTPSAHGLYTPWGLTTGPAMYFISKDGIYQTTGGQESSIVENDIKPLFPTYDTPGQTIEGYEAIDYTQPDNMRLRYHNDEVYFSYVGLTTGTRQMLIYDILKKRWRNATCTVGISEVYTQPATESSLLYGTVSGTVYGAGGISDPADLDIIEGMSFSTQAGASTFLATTYYIRAVRFAGANPVGISYEFPIALGPNLQLVANFPGTPAGTTAYNIYIGVAPGQENSFTQFTASEVTATGSVFLTNPGQPGTMPTINPLNGISVNVRTGAHDQGAPLNQKQYGNVIFDLDPGGAPASFPITITPYINGEIASEAALTVTGGGRQQVALDLSDYFAFNTEYEITWYRGQVQAFRNGRLLHITINPVLYQYDTLYFLEPVSVTHWQTQPTSFAFPGFVHVRDCYIAIRSTAQVTFTVIIDGQTTLTYTLPSTNGQRLKQYVQLDSNKGLMYEFSLDSSAGFRCYEEDLEIRVKAWLGVLGYEIQRVIGAEASE